MDAQIAATIVTGLIGFASLIWKSSHDMKVVQQRHDNDRQDRLDAAAQASQERQDAAKAVADKLELAQLETRKQIDLNSLSIEATSKKVGEANRAALDAQTKQIAQIVDEARHHIATSNKEVYDAANDVNTKIEKLHTANAAQQDVITRLVQALAPAIVLQVKP